MESLLDDDLLELLQADEADIPAHIQTEKDRGEEREGRGNEVLTPLSFAQQRLWISQQASPGSSAYNLPHAFRLIGSLDISALETALRSVANRHDILRAGFRESDGVPSQFLIESIIFKFDIDDLSDRTGDSFSQALVERIEAHACVAFDLSAPPLIRAKLIKATDDEHILLLNMHHIVSDAWSNPILMSDLSCAYERAVVGNPMPLPRPKIQYSDYARWQRYDYMQSAECAAAATYWENYLGSDLQPLQLPRDISFSTSVGTGYRHGFAVPEQLLSQLNGWCARENIQPFVLALGAWKILMSRYSGQRDFVIGVPNAGRNRGEVQDLVGFFVNTQIYRGCIDSQMSVQDFLKKLRGESISALAHADYPVELYLEKQRGRSGIAPSQLFRTLFNWRVAKSNAPALKLGAVNIDFLSSRSNDAKCDIAIDIEYADDGMYCTLEYDANYFFAETVEQMAAHWKNLLLDIVDDCSQRIGELKMLDVDERRRQIEVWNSKQITCLSDRCVHELIEAQVEANPEAIAIVFDDQQLTYRELNTRANSLSHRLIELNVGPDVLVGLAVERSLEMIVGILAILKAGGAYVPLDPSYPSERLAYMVRDSGIRLLLTSRASRHIMLSDDALKNYLSLALPVIAVLDIDSPETYTGNETNPAVSVHTDNLAYVIYTSGSTGNPKGALLPHANILRLFKATEHWFGFDRNDTWTLFHSYAFDFSVWEIFGALLYGGRLVIVPHNVSRSPDEFYALLCRAGVTVLNQTPSAFKQLIQVALSAQNQSHHLRYVIFGGEALDVQSLAPWFQRFGARTPQLINMYGITETTVHVTYRPLALNDLDILASPIGERIPDLSWYLLNEDMHNIATGCTGELFVGGAGLARGYHGRPALTAQRFIPDPFDTKGGRLYRTGDLVRYRRDNEVEYIGRIDHQIKIRGFRIEIGEIEARLQADVSIREAVVMACEIAGHLQLVAYVVPADVAVIDAYHHQQREFMGSVKSALKTHLPDYMVPAYIIVLDKFPLTSNGKFDRKALPTPDSNALQQTYKAPQTKLERCIADIWQQLLRIERVGLSDNFFELGGHSILAIEFISQLRKREGIELRLQDFLANSVLGELCQHLSGCRNDDNCIVPLNNSINLSRQLFCIHPSGGMVFSYGPLAQKMKEQAMVHGVMHRISTDRSELSWRDMIDEYCQQIRDIQPVGPYRLMGWSLGGSIAWDIASHLERQGHQVSFLGLIDTTIPEALIPAHIPRRARHVAKSVTEEKKTELVKTLELFALLFPKLAETAAALVQSEVILEVSDFYAWAAKETASESAELYKTLETIKAEINHAQAFSLAERLEKMFDDFEFSVLHVKPSCWWSSLHKTDEQIAYTNNILRDYNTSGDLNCSVELPFSHETIILEERTMESFMDFFDPAI